MSVLAAERRVTSAELIAAIAELRRRVHDLEPIYPGDLEAVAAAAAERGDWQVLGAARVALAYFGDFTLPCDACLATGAHLAFDTGVLASCPTCCGRGRVVGCC